VLQPNADLVGHSVILSEQPELFSDIVMKASPIAGTGVFAKNKFTKGATILNFVGYFKQRLPPQWKFRSVH
jgi:hypothetical protein